MIDLPDWAEPTGSLPGLDCRTTDSYPQNGPFSLYAGSFPLLTGFTFNGPLASWVRKATATYKTYIDIDGYWEIGASSSGPWSPQTDDSIPAKVVPIKSITEEMSEDYVSYQWLLRPSLNGGHGILRATFSPPAGYDASFYKVVLSSAGYFADPGFYLECIGVKAPMSGSGECKVLPLYGKIGGVFKSAPRQRFYGVYKMLNNLTRTAGYLKFYWANVQYQGPGVGNTCNLGGSTYRFPSMWKDPSSVYSDAITIAEMTEFDPSAAIPNMPNGIPQPYDAYNAYGAAHSGGICTLNKSAELTYASGWNIGMSFFGIGGCNSWRHGCIR